MPHFQGAHNFSINANQVNQIENYNAGGNMKGGFEMLLEHVVTSAFDDESESYDQPRCHPRTREQVQGELVQWAMERNEKEKVKWVYGPAGAGKSAIARSVFARDDMKDVRCGFFAFKRGSGERDRAGPLVPTLAYQLATTIDVAKDYICRAIERDPKIFSKSIETQMRTLMVEPLEKCSQHNNEHSLCFIIDGLDECTDARTQATIITSVVKTVAASQVHAKFMIFSRPELEIRTTFRREDLSYYCHFVELDERFKPDQDIELFVRDKFDEIKRSHGISQSLYWPTESQIISIVGKSTGQFIYAATVVKYVVNPRRNPIDQLKIVLELQPNHEENPFAELDSLYTLILQQSHASYQKVSNIFITLIFGKQPLVKDNLKLVSEFIGETIVVMKYTLMDLHSIVNVPNYFFEEVVFHHASFIDFLQDKTRSDLYYIDSENANTYLARQYMVYMAKHKSEDLEIDEFTESYFFEHLMKSSDECFKYAIEECGESYCHTQFLNWAETSLWQLYVAIGNMIIIISNDDLFDPNDTVPLESDLVAHLDIPRRIFSEENEVVLPCWSGKYVRDPTYHHANGLGRDYTFSKTHPWLLEYIDELERPLAVVYICSASFLETKDENNNIIFDVEKAFSYSVNGEPQYIHCPMFFKYLVEWIAKAKHINLPKQVYLHIFNSFLTKSNLAFDPSLEDLAQYRPASLELSRYIESERAEFIHALERHNFEPWRIEMLQESIDELLQARNDNEARDSDTEEITSSSDSEECFSAD